MLETVKKYINKAKFKEFDSFYTEYIKRIQDSIIEREIKSVEQTLPSPSSLVSGINSIQDMLK